MSDKRLKIILPVGIMIVGIAATFAILKSRGPVPTRPPEAFAPYVRFITATPQTRQLHVSSQGTVSPRTETTLVSEVTGRVLSINPSFASGGYFEKGEVILTIDPTDYELAVVSAKSDVAGARVLLETEEAQAKIAREEWRELGAGEGSPLATRELQVEQARAALAAAEARLKQAQRNLDRTRVRAPFVCRVRSKQADVGRYLARGTAVAQIYAIDYVEIRLPVPDADLAFVDFPMDYRGERDDEPGPRVALSAKFAGERRTWTGRVVRIEGEIDPVSRMVNVVAQVDDPYGRREADGPPLTIGMFVDAAIAGRVLEDAVVLPRAALRGENRVYVIDDDNRMHFRDVTVARAAQDSVFITAGLDAGERVCVSSLEAVTDGMTVRTEADALSPARDEEDGETASAGGDGS